jgi:phosphatidylglycerophosphate synthase
MKLLPDWLKNGYLKVIDPVANWLVRRGVHPNTITVIGTLCTIAGGTIYATGHIKTGGWFLGATALFDVLDGTVARRSNKSSTFGAFLDSTLDRLADGALLGGLAVVYALNPRHHNVPMVVVCLAGLIGAYLTSYIRARAEALGVDAKVGMVQRPEHAAHGGCVRTDHDARRRAPHPTHYRKNILAASQTPDRHAPIVLKGE